jgi:hypothetical protein
LKIEEQRERDAYSLGMPEGEMFTYKPMLSFESEKTNILASARKNQTAKPYRN